MADQPESNLIPFPQSGESPVLSHLDRAKRQLEQASPLDAEMCV